MKWLMDYLNGFHFNTALAVWLYWVPLLVCVIGYLVRTVQDYRKDLAVRSKCEEDRADYFANLVSETDRHYRRPPDEYRPKLTVGRILARVLAAGVPAVNLCAAICDIGPPMFRRFFEILGKTFDFPLVPPRK